MSGDRLPNDQNIAEQEEINSGEDSCSDDEVLNENLIDNSGIYSNQEKFLTEEELASICAEKNDKIDALDFIDTIVKDTQILRPLFQNVSASYADEVPFLVDGDSLIITLMNDGDWSPQLGGSTLHLVYLFERYLNIFEARGGTFHVVFFDSWRNIWNQNWNILLYRLLIINHFKKNTSYGVHIFDNCFDRRFFQFLSIIRPGFILFNMDAYMSCLHIKNIDKNNLRNITNITLLTWLHYDLPCIDTNFIEVDVSVVKGYYLEANPTVRTIVKTFGGRFKKFIQNIPKIEEYIENPMLTNMSTVGSVRRAVFLYAAVIFNDMKKDEELIKVFFLTEALMEYLQLENRSCPKFTETVTELDEIVDEWLKCMFFALSKLKLEDDNFNWLTISDLWQGILFGHVCRFAITEIESRENLGAQLATNYENIIHDFNQFGISISPYPIHLSMSLNMNWEILASLQINQREQFGMPLVPIHNSLVLEFCGDILNNINWAEPSTDLFATGKYTEYYHYHVLKIIRDEYDSIKDTFGKCPTDDATRRYWYLRNLSTHARYMSLYGSSIEGRPLGISSVVRNVKQNGKEEKPQKRSKKAQIIIDQEKEKKSKIFEEKEKDYLKNIDASIKKTNVNLEEVLNNIDKMIIKIRPDSLYQIDALFSKLKVLMRMLKENNKIFEIKKNIYKCSYKICTFKSTLNITQKQKEFLSKCLSTIGCNEIARRNGLPVASSLDDDDDGWIRFQLEKLGPELYQEVSGIPDPRTKYFIPDPWQKKLFDIVDRKESAVIIAPTSSGKTYASYYCMETVLREGDTGIVVYVAPTKALVNQVAATVYARFKDTKMPDGMSVYGVFTRDFKTNATNCQILVTVPEAFEILLTSPRRYGWTQRLRYVIFDEVHCIAGDLSAVAFERCLLLIRCPFLALSATIRNPRLLQSWLQKAEHFKQLRDVKDGVPEKQSYKVNLVEHSERHSDLIKYTYGNGELHHLHPYASVDDRVVRNHEGLPKHIALSPAETMQLYDAMLKATESNSHELNKLSPTIYFSIKPENGFISRNMVQEYTFKLKSLLETWFTSDTVNYKRTIQYLQTKDMDDIVGTGNSYILRNIVDFVLNLERKNMLPAIIFAYNRSLVYNMTETLTEHFVNSKNQINRRDEKKAIKQEKLEKKLKEKEAAKQKIESTSKRNKKTLNLISSNTDKSLQGIGTVTSDDIRFIERRLMSAGIKPGSMCANAIKNGIMMHHGGLGVKIRSAVEMLFRQRMLNVVFATGTLALGIHMPCKTTVIAGNSAYLNSLEYHQMSGRAGRRGYDTTGNVIFFGLNPRKQHSLLTAKLPDLKGNYPVTVTYILRLMLLVTDVTEKGKKSDEATKVTISRVMSLLENSLSFMHNPNFKINIKHFFSFSLQLLKKQEYINDNGEPLKWCGLITHLHYHEPGNLAFVHLLRSGAIRKLCMNNDKNVNVEEQLIIVLSHLFNRIPINSSSKQEFQNSKVILDPLPDFIRESLECYNAQVKFIFDQYFLNVASYFKEDDNELPLSSVKFVGTHSSSDTNNYSSDNLQDKFLKMCVPKLVCSSFAALSGNDDNNLYSSENLVDNIKHKMSTDVKIIPLIDLNTQLNSYALDFYKHEIVEAIRRDNGLKSGLEYSLLTDFLLILKTVVVSFEEMELKNENDIVYQQFKILENKYLKKHSKAFQFGQYK